MAAAASQRTWAALAALAVLAACSAASGARAQLVGVDVTNSTLVLTSAGFAQALRTSNIAEILISSDVKLKQSDFQPTVFVDHNVTIAASSDAPTDDIPDLDFDHGVGLILVGSQGNLGFSSLRLSNLANADVGNASGDNVVQALAVWPTISGQPGAVFSFNDTIVDYTVPNDFNGCEQYQQRVVQQLRQLLGARFITQPDNTTVLVTGRHVGTLPVTNNQLGIGEVEYISSDTVVNCVADSTGGGSHFPWWAGLILGLGLALIILAVLGTLAVRYVLRLRHQNSELASSQRDIESKGDAGTGTTGSANTPPGGSGWTPTGSADPTMAGKEGTGGSGNSTLVPLLPGEAGLRTSSNPRARSGTMRLDSNLSDYHAQLLAMRMQSGLEGVEIGPVLGRGSFGCVYKGRWRGVLVAVKVMEAPMDQYSADAARESLLSASISHPNVVACYKICAVRTPAGETSSTERTATSASLAGPGKNASQVLTDADVAAAQAAPGATADVPPPVQGLAGVDGPPATGQIRRASTYDSETTMTSATRSHDNVLLEVLGTQDDAQDTQSQGTIETWMLLEYADRGSLEQAIQARRFYKRTDATLDLGNVYRTLLDIANGMHYLHCVGIIHGDLKPANVLLKSTASDARGFICKLADFGLSRLVSEHKTHVSAATMGTVSYMPPEMLNEQRLTKAVDVYSLGVIMCQLYSGATPYAGMGMPAVLFAVVHKGQRPDVPADMPPDYKELMQRCWDNNAQSRPTVEEVIRELALQAKAVATQAAAPPVQALQTAKRNSFSIRELLGKKKSSSSDSEGGGGGGARLPPPRRITTGSSSSSAGRRSGSATPDLEDSAGPPAAVAVALAAVAAAEGAREPAPSAPQPAVASPAAGAAGPALPHSESQASATSNADTELSFAANLGTPLASPSGSAEPPEAAAPPVAASAAAAAAAAAAGGSSVSVANRPIGPPQAASGRQRTDPLYSVAEEISRAGSSGSSSGRNSMAGRFASKTAPHSFAFDRQGSAPVTLLNSDGALTPVERQAAAAAAAAAAPVSTGAPVVPPSENLLRQASAEMPERFRPLMQQSTSEGGTIRYSLEGRRGRRSMDRRRAHEAPAWLEPTLESPPAKDSSAAASAFSQTLGSPARKVASAGDAGLVSSFINAGPGRASALLQPGVVPSPFLAAASIAMPADEEVSGSTYGRLADGGSRMQGSPPPEAAAAGLLIPPKDDSLGAAADAAVQKLAEETELRAAASAALHSVE